MLKVAIRTDASYEIGTGHVMRCITLAKALKDEGVHCKFICRILEGHLIGKIKSEGFAVEALPASDQKARDGLSRYERWAGIDWQTDAAETIAQLKKSFCDWLVLDHYSFDSRWQQKVSKSFGKLLVIDDLANRPHAAKLLVDQNLGREADAYDELVSPDCNRLVGPRYAILRQEFKLAREQAIQSRSKMDLKNILIAFGGVDRFDVTSKVLNSLTPKIVPGNAQITVILGASAFNLKNVYQVAEKVPWVTKVLVNVSNIADYFIEADIAVCSVGGTTWERCCLGLPSILVPTAKHEDDLARHLHRSGAALNIGPYDETDFEVRLTKAFNILKNEKNYSNMCNNAFKITDGSGVDLVVQAIQRITVTT